MKKIMSKKAGSSVAVQGRIIVRERMTKENVKVKFYSLGTVKGWYQLSLPRTMDMDKIEVPGLVEVTITGLRSKRNTAEDGTVYENKTAYVSDIKNIESAPEYEAMEQARLDKEFLN